jgi:hypothetical protein
MSLFDAAMNHAASLLHRAGPRRRGCGRGPDAFLGGHRVLAVDHQFVADGANRAWGPCVGFDESDACAASRPSMGKRGKIEFKNVLAEPEFAVFAPARPLLSRVDLPPPDRPTGMTNPPSSTSTPCRTCLLPNALRTERTETVDAAFPRPVLVPAWATDLWREPSDPRARFANARRGPLQCRSCDVAVRPRHRT